RLAAPGQSDSYIVKIDGATNTVVYSTYLSGNGDDLVADIAVDASGRVYITGKTSSSDFPGANPVDYQGDDVFVARLSADGSAVDYAEYYGGSAQEYATAITIDNNNNASISGFTNSNVSDHQFVLINSLQSSLADNNGDGFVAQFDSSGNLTFSSYLGGSGQDEINDIAADNAGNLYVVGGTFSADFPVTAGAYQTDGGNLSKDAIVTKINTASPAAIIYSTFIGGSGEDSAYSLAVNSSGEAFVGGYAGVGLPMINALQPNHGGGARDGFIAKLNSAGSALQYSSFLGGFSRDSVRAIALDSNGDILIAGRTESANFPRMGPFQINLGGGVDGFVSKLSGDGTPLKFSSFIGGSENESLSALALDSNDNLVVVGVTHSADFPLTDDAIQSEFAQGVQGDLFAGRITNTDASTDLSVSTSVIQKTYSVDEPLSFTISVANHGPDTATDVSATFALPANTTYQSMSAPGFLCQLTESGYTCSNAIIKADSIADIVLNLVTSSEGSAVLSVVIDNSTEGDTNSENNTASATVSISNENNSTTPPEEDNNDVSGNNNSSSSGGGGSVNLPLLITLLVLAIGRYKSFAADGNKRQVLTRQQH
ncbi:MAG: SBBP repeat-containing protein, partial [Exilibacterium sp.]